MAFAFRTTLPPDGAYVAYIRKLNSDWSSGVLWNNSTLAWDVSSTVPLAANAHEIPVTQVSASSADKSQFVLNVSVNLATYTGWAEVAFIDQTPGYDYVTNTERVYISNGLLAREPFAINAPQIIEGLAENTERLVRVLVKKFRDATEPATGSVVSTQIGYPGGTLTSATNQATYTGVPGYYSVLLTAEETFVSQDLRDDLYLEITTSDGSGGVYLEFSENQIDQDWTNGGRLDIILDAINQRTTNLDTSISVLVWPAIQALPTAADMADAVWDEPITAHVAADSAGERLERMDLFQSGGAGEFTTAAASAITTYLDAPVSGCATEAEVGTQCLAAMVSLHLDHLFDAAYDPAGKPGNANGLLNVLVESDGGVPRFTINALENVPAASVSVNAAAIADAVWDEALAGHLTVGTAGAALGTSVPAILADTGELQADWANGGRLDLILDATATAASVAGLNDIGTADIDARLASFYTTTLDPRFDNLDNGIASVISIGNSSWTTATGFSTHTAADVRAEMDASSTQLAAIVADTNELQTDWADGGRLDTLLDNASTDAAAAIRAEIDANSTQLAAIVADTNELQAAFAVPGGTLYDILNTRSDDTIESKITDIDTTLEPGGVIHTLISNITPFDNTLSAEQVAKARRWEAPEEGAIAKNTVYLSEGDNLHVAMRFKSVLNPDTSIASVGGVTVVEGDAGDLSFGTAVIAQNYQEVHVKVSGQLSGKQYKIKFAITTTDNETMSAIGTIQVN